MREYIPHREVLGKTVPLGPVVMEWDAEEVWSGLELAGDGTWVGDMRSDFSINGDYSLYMKTDDPGVPGAELEAHFLLYPAPHGSIKFNIPFLFPDMTGSVYWNFSIQAIHALPDHTCVAFTLLYIWPLYWYVGTTSAGSMVWEYIDGSDQVLATNTWHYLTLRANYDTPAYVDFSCDALQIDLSDWDPVEIYYAAGSTNREFMVFLMNAYAYGSQSQPPTEIYFDNFTFYEE